MRIQLAFSSPFRGLSGSRVVLSAVAAIAATTALLAWSGSFRLDGSAVWSVAGLQLAVLLCAALWLVSRITVSREAAITEAAVPLAAIGDLVTWHDSFGDVVLASAASSAVLGVAPRTLCAGGLLARVHVSDRPSYLKALSDAANGGEAVTVRFRLHAEDQDDSENRRASVIWAEMRAYRIRPADWKAGVSVVIASTRDISAQQKHAEELDAARREAERANELKGRFLATVSHELRTPLNAIIGFSELLSADHPFLMTEERRKEYAQIIRGSGHHLLEIVNTLLDMSKIDSGNFDFDPEPFGFGELAASVCNLMQLKAEDADVRIERRIAAGLPDITADRRACRQILINLVSNAVKFTPAQGQVTVAITASAEDLVLSVADTGIGIAEADLPRLGDPFFQSGDVHRRNHEGTGLGLSVVRGLVGLHRGRMSIESGTGAGTTVTVTLPLRGEADLARPKPVTVQDTPADRTPPAGEDERVTHRGGTTSRPGASRPSPRNAVSRAARIRSAAFRFVGRRPGLVLASVAVIGGAGVFGWNVLMKQPAPHPAPLFAAAKPGPVAATPPPRPADVASAPAIVPAARNEASLPVVRASLETAAKPLGAGDPIGALIRGGEPGTRAAADVPKAAQPRVAAAQKALAKLGYGPIAPDGVLGAGTRQALERFERARSLPVTGALGPRTAKQLASLSGVAVE